MANPYTYGTGTAGQFTDATQRQILELGDKIHFYNPDMTPLLTIGGRVGTNVTPVPIFEWMEDEWFIQQTVSLPGTALKNAVTAGHNDTGVILRCDRQSQVEMFEVGAVYSLDGTTMHASNGWEWAAGTDAPLLMCVAIGKACDTSVGAVGGAADPSDLDVRFIGGDTAAPTFTYEHRTTTQVCLEANGTSGNIVLTHIGNAGEFSTLGRAGYSVDSNDLVDNETATITGTGQGWNEGAAIGQQTSKKVRRLKNCTQIFREPYTITGTMMNSSHYGGDELSRLQARKLAKIKSDIEWAMLTNGDIDLDDDKENPKRTFAGFGLNKAAGKGVIKSNDGRTNTNCQWTVSSGLDNLDAVCEYIFRDLLAGSMSKTVFCSNKFLKNLVIKTRDESSTQLNASLGEGATSGLRVMKHLGPVGELNFIAHPFLNNGTLEDYALSVDMANFEWRPLSGRDMQLRSDVVKDGRDGRTDEWLLEGGCEIRNEQSHAIIKMV
tara:strand:- start:15937 stop:17415 length:1479 start_codon:yes stop_codon:yes gene_type:complete